MTQKQENTKPLPNEDELRERIADIFGLEVAPDGLKYQLLEYDDMGNVLGGADYREEVEEAMHLFREYAKGYALGIIGEDEHYPPDYHRDVIWGRNKLRAEQRSKLEEE